MDLHTLHNKSDIFGYLNKHREFHLYAIGDLDDFFWPKTTWYGLISDNEIQSIALLYAGMDIPTLLLFHEGDSRFAAHLLEKIIPILPNRFYAHLSPDLLDIIGRQNIDEYYGLLNKMVLGKTVQQPDDPNIKKLLNQDLSVIQKFYAHAYPHNWFDSRMLETGKYYGYFINGILAGISGIHVYSEEYKVAALGNIATHPDFRGQQIAYKLTSALCYNLQGSVNSIGLNVKSDNEYAIKCYKKIGFECIGTFDECLIKLG